MPVKKRFRLLSAPACLALMIAGPCLAQTLPPTGPNAATSEARLHYWMTSTDQEAVVLRAQVANGPQALADARAALEADGIPLTPEKLQHPLPPPDQNAAPFYTSLYPLLNPGVGEGGPIVMVGGLSSRYAYTPHQLVYARQEMARQQTALHLIHQASARPLCVFSRDWTQGMDQPTQDLRINWVWRPSVILIAMESYLLARQGKYEAAVANADAGFALARHAGSDPFFLREGSGCETATLDSLNDILSMAGPRASADRAVASAIAAHPYNASLRDALAVSLGYQEDVAKKSRTFFPKMAVWSDGRVGYKQEEWIPLTEELGRSQPRPHPALHPLTSRPLTSEERTFIDGLLDVVEADSLRQIRSLFQIADGPDPARRAAVARFQTEALNISPKSPMSIANRILPGYGDSYDVVQHNDETMPIYITQANQLAFLHAEEQVLQASAAILEAKATIGMFPLTLPPTFTDPFTGKPLHYRREGKNGFLVFSVGPNGDTSGSQPYNVMRQANQASFRYPPPQPQPTPPWMISE